MKPCLLCLQSCGAPKEKGDPEAWEPKGVRLGWDWGSPTPRVNLGPQSKRPRSAPMPSGTEFMLAHAGSNSALRFLDILINSTNMCGSLRNAASIVGDNPQPVEFLFCLSNRSFEWRIYVPSMHNWGNRGPGEVHFYKGGPQNSQAILASLFAGNCSGLSTPPLLSLE